MNNDYLTRGVVLHNDHDYWLRNNNNEQYFSLFMLHEQ